MKRILCMTLLLLSLAQSALAIRIKDIASFDGVRDNQLIGYGLVVGLDGPTRGCTIPDRRHRRPDPNIRVLWSVDEAAFKRRLFAACAD